MPRRKRTLPFAFSSSPASVALLDEKRWREIERKYGFALQPDVRLEVTNCTNQFLLFAPSERTAEPLDKSLKYIDEMGALTMKLRDALFEGRHDSATTYAYVAIDRHLSEVGVDRDLAGIGTLAAFIHIACDRAKQELSQKDIASYLPGSAWNGWVLELQGILDRYRLSTSVRKDSDKSLNVSPFVRFVRALERSFDKALRCGATSDAACAQMIYKARKARRDFLSRKEPPDKSRKADC